eukprot:6177837-Pleurochrysis_carterae.AAC.4
MAEAAATAGSPKKLQKSQLPGQTKQRKTRVSALAAAPAQHSSGLMHVTTDVAAADGKGAVPGTERQQVKAALMLASSHSQVAGFEEYTLCRPFRDLEALQLTDRVVCVTGEVMTDLELHLHIVGRVMKDISAERVLCNVLVGGGRIIRLQVGRVGGHTHVQLPVVGCGDALVVSSWAATTAESVCWS